MSETATSAAPQAQDNPLLTAWQTPHQTPPFDAIKPEHFLPAFEQAFADHSAEIAAITHDPATPDFANTITALERSGKLLNKVVGRVLRPGVGAFQPGDPGDRQGGVAADGAALESDHDERRAVRPHRAAAREPRQPEAHGRADAAAGADLHPLPPRRRRPLRGGQDADGRDQRAAGPSWHKLQPSSARRRAGLVAGARRGRLRRAIRQLRGGRQGRGRRARHGRQGDRDAVALLRRAVPEELGPARPAREGLQGLHRPRRQWQRQRQQRGHRRDPGAARGEREAPGLSDLRRLSARGLHGQDAGGRARPAGAGLEAGAGAGARRPRRAAGADRGGGRQFRARALGLALLRREAPPAQSQFRRRRDQALSRAGPHDRGRLRLRHAPVRHHLRRAQGHPGLASRRPGLGGQGRERRATRRCSMATTLPGPRSAPAPG